jgi:gluconate 2-dehydrogenase gamma chain
MEPEDTAKLDRRRFLQRTLIAAGGAAALAPRLVGAGPSETPASGPGAALPPPAPAEAVTVYESFSPDEAAFVEAMVTIMCPADGLTPNGVDCGLALFIDRQLAGGFGKGERLYRRGPWRKGRPELGYQLPLTPEEFFKAGLAAADAACRRRHGRAFAALDPAEADRFLHALAGGEIADGRLPLAQWFNELVYPLFNQACFSDPIYGGNKDKVFWRMIGYPGLPAVNGLNMVKYRGKPFPGAKDPKSIEDFS